MSDITDVISSAGDDARPESAAAAAAESVRRSVTARSAPAFLRFPATATLLLEHPDTRTPPPALLAQLAESLRAEGLPLLRASFSLGDFRPDVIGRSLNWWRDRPLEDIDRRWSPKRTAAYWTSPVRVINEGAEALRRRLDGPGPFDFPVLDEIKAAGGTDYVAFALPGAGQDRNFAAFAADAPGGFAPADLIALDALAPVLGLRLAAEHHRQMTEQLLATYLGREASERVIRGDFRRIAGEHLPRVILISDLRASTRLYDTLPAASVFEALSLYFEILTSAIALRGGDVVKLVGDGVIAAFAFDPAGDGADAATRAGEAALVAAEELAAQEPTLLPPGVGALRAGFALHTGEVIFGNVGGRERLDFTVLGPAVNVATRLETLTKTLQRPVLASAAFAALKPRLALESLGAHALRGVGEPVEVFAVSR